MSTKSVVTSICVQATKDTQRNMKRDKHNQRNTINPSKNVNKVRGNIDLSVGHQRNTKRHKDTQPDTKQTSKNINKVSDNIDLSVGHQRYTKRYNETQRQSTIHNQSK